MSPDDFVDRYAAALATQDWSQVAPLIAENASVVFSNGSLHRGKEAIRTAYQCNFDAIKGEDYRIENVHWLARAPETAAYMFDFFWSGIIDGRESNGSGRGTTVLVRQTEGWVMMAEQLGPRASS